MFQFNQISDKLIKVRRANDYKIGEIIKDIFSDWVFKCELGQHLDVADMIQICNKINELENRI